MKKEQKPFITKSKDIKMKNSDIKLAMEYFEEHFKKLRGEDYDNSNN